ncbi:hypothetical protein P692DRAFT_20839398 [Suillus brevipes Sb2]|nr:hypothetical protein P692DRAFT_20839398 [Suillus brevipes Sb2]
MKRKSRCKTRTNKQTRQTESIQRLSATQTPPRYAQVRSAETSFDLDNASVNKIGHIDLRSST